MEIVSSPSFIKRSDNFTEEKFKIAANAKTFKILSDSIYSNKIQAIIRELSCNAYDAHVAAGNKDLQFSVHLPSKAEPFFRIRDLGTGLSREDVFKIYSTYFESTKTNSNDFVGCLGLGSKTPFSYTDNFTVTSYFNGEKSIYSSFIGEDGTPSIALVHEESTNLPNGLEISFAVKEEDVSSFYDEAANVYAWFDLPPAFEGSSKPSIRKHALIKRKGFSMFQSGGYAGVLMGNVFYRIELHQLRTVIPDDLFAIFSALPGLVLEFPIGAVSVATSREALSYDKLTVLAIRKKLEDVAKTIDEELQSIVNSCSSKWTATIALSEFQRYRTFIQAALKSGRYKHKGEPVLDVYKLSQAYAGSKYFWKRFWRVNSKPATQCIHESYSAFAPASIEKQAWFVFVDKDDTKKVYSEHGFRAWMRSDNSNIDRAFYVIEATQAEIKEIVKATGLEHKKHWHFWHEIPKPPAAPRSSAGNSVKKTEAKKWINGWSKYEDIDLKNGEGVWIERKGDSIVSNPSPYTDWLSHFRRLHQEVYGKSIDIWGLTPRQISDLGPGWVNVLYFAKEERRKIIADKSFIAGVLLSDELRSVGLGTGITTRRYKNIEKIFKSAEAMGFKNPLDFSLDKIDEKIRELVEFNKKCSYLTGIYQVLAIENSLLRFKDEKEDTNRILARNKHLSKNETREMVKAANDLIRKIKIISDHLNIDHYDLNNDLVAEAACILVGMQKLGKI